MKEMQLHLEDERATIELAQDLSLILKQGDCILLSGDLGAGKTTFARALIRHLASDPELEVPSPTYTLVQSYQTDLPVAHYDFYRLGSSDEIHELGLDDALETGIAIIEWPQTAGDQIRSPSMLIHFEQGNSDNGRSLKLTLNDEATSRVARTLEIREFLNQSGFTSVERKPLTGDASTRAYEQFQHNGETHLLMNSPRQPDGPIIKDGKPYSQIANLSEDISAFIAVDETLRDAGFNAPTILARDIDRGLLVSNYLGDQFIIDENRQPIPERYMASIEMLAEHHQRDWKAEIILNEGITYTIPPYDEAAMLIEADLLLEWYAEDQIGRPADQQERDTFHSIWSELYQIANGTEISLVLRDFHSPNILWCAENHGTDRIGLIDFQDALIGPSAYDVASLAQDARVDISETLEKQLVDHYISQRLAREKAFDVEAFREAYAIMAALRATKILGIFIRLSKRDGKHEYLKHLPRMERYLKTSLKNTILSSYKSWLDKFLSGETNGASSNQAVAALSQ